MTECRDDEDNNREIEMHNAILSIISFTIAFTGCMVSLYAKPKYKHFPHSIPAILSASISLQSLLFFLQDLRYLYYSHIFLFVGNVCISIIWTTSLIVLYQATVLLRPIYIIRHHRKRYYGIISILLLILIIPPIIATAANTCCIIIITVLQSITSVIAIIVFSYTAPKFSRILLDSTDHEHLEARRSRLLISEARRQITLGIVLVTFLLASSLLDRFVVFHSISSVLMRCTGTLVGLLYLHRPECLVYLRLKGNLIYYHVSEFVILYCCCCVFSYNKDMIIDSDDDNENDNDRVVLQMSFRSCKTPRRDNDEGSKKLPKDFESGCEGAVTGCSAAPEIVNRLYTNHILNFVREQLLIEASNNTSTEEEEVTLNIRQTKSEELVKDRISVGRSSCSKSCIV